MSDAADQHPADNMPGRALAVARAAQNLSVADVARHLRLTTAQVQALEAGAYERLPGPVFVRGFMRNYARLLKMDPERLLQAARLDLPAPAVHEAAPPSRDIPFPGAEPRRWPWYAAATAAIVAGLAFYEFYWGDPRQEVITTVTAPGSASIMQEPAVPAPVAAVQAPAEPPAGAAEETGQAPPAVPEGMPAARKEMGTAEQAAAPSAPEGKQAAGAGTIVLAFDRESWVQIRDGRGRTIFLKHNQPGTEQQVNGLPPFTLVIGNAGGVRLTYNDRPVDLSHHAKDDVARLTLE